MLPIFQLYQTAQEEIAHHFSEKKKQLKFEFFQGISKRYIVLPILNELMVLLPDIQLELSTAEMDTILDDVRENKADLAVTNIHECEDVGELKILPLLNIPGSVVISYLHPWMAKEFITAEDMSAMPVLYLSRKAGPDTKGFYGQLKASAYRFAPTYNAMLAQLELGKEYSVFPALFENIKDSGFKTFKLPPEFHINHTISLIYREDNPYAGYFEALTLLKKEIETQAEFLKIRI